MVVLITLLQTTHYGNGSCRRGLVHHDHLEATLQRLVRLEIFLIFVEGCGTYCPEFPSRQCRLEDIGCIHCTGSPASPDQRMYLIDEKNHLSITVHNFLDHSFETFLELSLILGSSDQGTKVKRIYLSALEIFRHIPVYDLLGDSFRNRSLSDSRLTHQYRIILGSPAENLQYSSYLLISSDDGIQLPLRRSLIEVDGKPAQVFKSVFCHNLSSIFYSKPSEQTLLCHQHRC